MKLYHYIIASLLSHLLLFSAIAVLLPETDNDISFAVFDIDIVGYLKDEVESRENKKKPLKLRPTIKKPSRKDILEETPPKTMFGEGTDSEPAESGKEETEDKELPTGEKGVSPKDSKGLPAGPKSFLFDEETIEKYAQKGIIGGKDLTFDAPEFHHRGYMRMLKERIESIWKYPEKAAMLGISGELYIRFSIKRDGSIKDVKLMRTSGYKDLDEAAIKALKDGEPYWPLPDDWEGDELSITGHFIYLTGTSYIM